MKRIVLNLLLAGVIIATGATGCRHKKVPVTDIYGRPISTIGDSSNPSDTTGGTLPIDSGIGSIPANPDGTIPLSNKQMNSGPQDRSILASETILFDLDSATVKSSEKSKLDKVADYLKANPTHDVLIEGHCDERGTEGYNLSLGERRALAAREYLASVGAPAEHIYTRTFGETKPAVDGHDDAAWTKNRRDEFVVVLP